MVKPIKSSKSLLFIALVVLAMWFVSCRQVHAQTNFNPDGVISGVEMSNVIAFYREIQAERNATNHFLETITFSNGQPILTNGVTAPASTTNAVSFELAPVVHLLFGDSSWVSKLLAWIAAFAAALAPFRTMIRHTIADRFNAYAAASTQAQDDYLRGLFSSKWYMTFGFLLSFAGITLPTLSDLERAVAQQHEAVVESKSPPPPPPSKV